MEALEAHVCVPNQVRCDWYWHPEVQSDVDMSGERMHQEDIWRNGEGDRYFDRNYSESTERVALTEQRLDGILDRLPFLPKRILEIGCSFGPNLDFYRRKTNADCYGVDLSEKALNEGKKLFPEVNFSRASAVDLPYTDGFFDFVSFDGCLYTFDPSALFKAAAEADRVLSTNGILVIFDFDTPLAYRNSNRHDARLYSYKFRQRDMFLWHPAYSLIELQSMSHEQGKFTKEVNERLACSILYKTDMNDSSIFLTNPFEKRK